MKVFTKMQEQTRTVMFLLTNKTKSCENTPICKQWGDFLLVGWNGSAPVNHQEAKIFVVIILMLMFAGAAIFYCLALHI